MARRAFSTPQNTWKVFKQQYVEVFSIALAELAGIESIAGEEDAISEGLILILRRVCFKINRSRRGMEIRVPVWEAPIPPVSEDELTGGKRRKRPDFTCTYYNTYADSPEQQEISFHVECKRLGPPTSPTWNLNENYVLYGIKRFDCITHVYGKRAPSGMMIGYIINMTPKEIEREVNAFQKKHLPDFPGITFNFDDRTPFRAHQTLRRNYVEPAQFELIHLWIDLQEKGLT